MVLKFILVLFSVFLLSVILEKKIIPILKSHKIGQKILEIGPRWHMSKEGTPTMGGICFIMAILFVMLVVVAIYAIKGQSKNMIPLALTLLFATLNGAIGFFDDYKKLVKKTNEGLKPWQKIVLQSAVAAIYLFLMSISGNLSTSLHIPFTNTYVEFSYFFYVFAFILIIGFVNSVNLTDGIDGLASSVTAIVFAFFALMSFVFAKEQLSIFSAAIIGATLGFLVYNFHPARVFMGDTGSLFLGGAVVGASFLLNEPLIIFIVGFVYLAEAFSDIIQVSFFKITHGKRIFKCAPLHHHFEKCGWSENKVVAVFSAITFLMAVVGFFALY